jgi:hypothetical protein
MHLLSVAPCLLQFRTHMFPWQLSGTCIQTWPSKTLSISHSLGLDYCASHRQGTQHDRVQGRWFDTKRTLKQRQAAKAGQKIQSHPSFITRQHSYNQPIEAPRGKNQMQKVSWWPYSKVPKGIGKAFTLGICFHFQLLSETRAGRMPSPWVGTFLNALSGRIGRPKDVEVTQCDVFNGSLRNLWSLSCPRNEDALFLLDILINRNLEEKHPRYIRATENWKWWCEAEEWREQISEERRDWVAQRSEESTEVRRAEKWREHRSEESKEVKRAEKWK